MMKRDIYKFSPYGTIWAEFVRVLPDIADTSRPAVT